MRFCHSFRSGIPLFRAGHQRVTHPFATNVLLHPFDLHVLGTPPAFILSQDQTLRNISAFRLFLFFASIRRNCLVCFLFLLLLNCQGSASLLLAPLLFHNGRTLLYVFSSFCQGFRKTLFLSPGCLHIFEPDSILPLFLNLSMLLVKIQEPRFLLFCPHFFAANIFLRFHVMAGARIFLR